MLSYRNQSAVQQALLNLSAHSNSISVGPCGRVGPHTAAKLNRKITPTTNTGKMHAPEETHSCYQQNCHLYFIAMDQYI